MLVRVKNVELYSNAFSLDTMGPDPNALRKNVRVSAALSSPRDSGTRSCQDPFPKPGVLTNEFMDLAAARYARGQKFASIVGVVTYFCDLHLAPRSPDDIKVN
jgi:hypothetical protein